MPRINFGDETRDGAIFLLLGCMAFLLIGFSLEAAAPVSTVDFRVVYFSARRVLEHGDPYSKSQLADTYLRNGGETPNDTPKLREVELQYIYFPSALPVTLPFALLPFGPAHVLWLLFTALILVIASGLMWEVSSEFAPTLSGFLVGLLIADSDLYLVIGNPGGVTVGLCVIASWCFLRNRYVIAGSACMALSLMLKPHISGLIWLFFLLAGGKYRKRALQTLVVVIVLTLPAVLWLSHVAPHWPQELRNNLAANGAPGGLSDPGPNSPAGHGIGMIVDLQTVFSLLRDDPKVYNPMAYVVTGFPICIWAFRTLRTGLSSENAWFAIAPIAVLSILPVYHRLYDARIILLAIPACSMLWARRAAVAKAAVILSFFAIFLTGAAPWAIFLVATSNLSWGRGPYSSFAKTLIEVLPVPLTLFAWGVLLLAVYLKRPVVSDESTSCEQGIAGG